VVLDTSMLAAAAASDQGKQGQSVESKANDGKSSSKKDDHRDHHSRSAAAKPDDRRHHKESRRSRSPAYKKTSN
jgi:hypothetical protein